MTLQFSKTFLKNAKSLKPGQKKRLNVAIRLFSDNQFDPSLNNHALTGKLKKLANSSLLEERPLTGESVQEVTMITKRPAFIESVFELTSDDAQAADPNGVLPVAILAVLTRERGRG